MSRLPMLSGFQVNQTSARDFECSVPPSLSQIGENVENVCWVTYEVCIYLMMIATFKAQHIVCDDIWTKDLRQIAAKYVTICWKMTRHTANFLCAGVYKNKPKRKGTSKFRAGDESRVYDYDFWCLTKKRWWWYLASVLLHRSLHGLFWFSEVETLLRGWRFKDILKTKLNCRQHWSTSYNRNFRGVSSCGRDAG